MVTQNDNSARRVDGGMDKSKFELTPQQIDDIIGERYHMESWRKLCREVANVATEQTLTMLGIYTGKQRTNQGIQGIVEEVANPYPLDTEEANIFEFARQTIIIAILAGIQGSPSTPPPSEAKNP